MKPIKSCLPISTIAIVISSDLNLSFLAVAQLRSICDNKPNYIRLTSQQGPPTGHGGNYETEICGILLQTKYESATFAIEINGKAGSGMGIYSMNCTNKPKGYWKAQLTISGDKEATEKMLPDALNEAAKIFC